MTKFIIFIFLSIKFFVDKRPVSDYNDDTNYIRKE